MTEDEIIDLCQAMGNTYPQDYTVPGFFPHRWVVEAIRSAYESGRQDGYNDGYYDCSADQ